MSKKILSVENGRLMGQAAELYVQNYIREHGAYPPHEYIEVDEIDGELTVIVEVHNPELTSAQKKARRLINGDSK